MVAADQAPAPAAPAAPPGAEATADEAFMDAALAAARQALALGEPPVGACIVMDGATIAAAHNGVIGGPDATAHAEILAIRAACRQQHAARLDGCTLYATVEPCPMCLAACHYAGITRVVYGASLADLHGITGSELTGGQFIGSVGGIEICGPVRAAECRALLADWARSA
jgi:tRNA(Arg) A34 adenosine deaminase TadA